MRIGYIDLYSPSASPHKDPITTPLVLKALGHDVDTMSCNPLAPDGYAISGLPIVSALSRNWREGGYDAVIAVSRFNPNFSHLLESIKAAGIPLIVKGDTDGTLGYPLRPNYLRMVPLNANPFNVLRHVKWRLPSSYWVKQKLTHMELADRVVVESPGAAVNLTRVLNHWERQADTKKIRFVPNQVSQAVIDRSVVVGKRRNIIAIGRWDDAMCKGTDLLVATIDRLLHLRGDYTFTVVGTGVDKVRQSLRRWGAERIGFVAETDFATLQDLLSQARILLVTSRMESFSFVSAEALCSGTSIVVTPIESLTYLSGGGAWGSISNDFCAAAITAALIAEIETWESNQRDPRASAAYWRGKLSPSATSALWNALLKEIPHR